MTTTRSVRHMSSHELQRHGQEVLEWIARYHDRVGEFPVLSTVRPGEVRALLPDAPPQTGEPFSEVMRDLDRIIVPGLTHWQSPNFFAFFPTGQSGPSILADLVASGLGVQGMLWATSPACTELETHVLDWMADLLGLPEAFTSRSTGGGVILDTASSATLCAAVAARERATGTTVNRSGNTGKLRAYISMQSHSSVEKSLKVAGIGSNNIVRIAVDEHFAMRPELLADAIRADRAAGLQPFFVCGTTGTTASGALDPLNEIGTICRREQLWFHVDAAMFGTAAICPEFRHLSDGLGEADSYCFNPHKWMLTTFDCDCFYVRDRAALISALTILPEYLKNEATASGAVIDYRDWQVPLGRRFRSLKLWFVLRWYGVQGIQEHVRSHVRLTEEFERRVKASKEFELAVPRVLNLVCFAHRSGNDASRTTLESANATGKVYLSHAMLGDRYVLRMCIGQTWTIGEHVTQAFDVLQTAARSAA